MCSLPRWTVAARTLCLGVLVVAGMAAQAAPDDTDDEVTRLLIERGLIAQDASGVPETNAAPAEADFTHRVRVSASSMVITAMNFLGVPYRRGGTDERTGFDCSGFTRHIFEHSIGLVLPRRVDDQASAPGLIAVKREELKPGDLVFFNTLRRTFSHVGIYVGDGKFIHSPRTGAVVRVEDMRFDYWRKRFTGARRAPVVQAAEAATEPDLPH